MKLLLAVTMLTAGCSGALAADPAAPALPRFSHPREITNGFLPLASLKQDILESKKGRIERSTKPDLHKTVKVGDQAVEALVLEDRAYEDGKLVEVAMDYVAQADDGTVCYLGEDVDEYKDGKITGHTGAWLYGKDTQKLGVLLPAHPKVGDRFQAEDVPKITREDDEVVSVSETVITPSGTYQNCVKVREKLSEGEIEYKYFAAGVGCVKEEEPDNVFLLKTHQTTNAIK